MKLKPWLRLLPSTLLSVRPGRRRGTPRPRRRSALELEGLEQRFVLSTYYVTTTADAPAPLAPLPLLNPLVPDEFDAGTLRAAMEAANANPGFDTIKFKIPTTDPGFNGQWWTIKLGPAGVHPATPGDDPRGEDLATVAATALPPITDGVLIDGLTQSSVAGNTNPGTVGSGIVPGVANSGNHGTALNFNKPLIAIDSNNSDDQDNCFQIDQATSNVTLRGMSVYDAGNAVKTGEFTANTATGTNRLVDQMFLGVLPDGLQPSVPTEQDSGWGVRVETEVDAFDVTPANPAQINLTVTHSYVGFNGLGGLNAGLATSVVDFEFNEVFENSQLSDFQDGIDIDGMNSIVRYNFSHDNRNLTNTANAEGGNGIEVGSEPGITPVGNNNTVEYNTSSFNVSAGVSIVAGEATNVVRYNVLNGNMVGITVDDEGEGGQTHLNQFNQNSTFMNLGVHTNPSAQGTGIDLQWNETPLTPWLTAPDGSNDTPATGQDPGDPDTGSNDLQNHPMLNSAVTFGSNTTVQGSLNSLPNTKFTIEFFRTPDMDSVAGTREGEYFIGQITVITDATGTATFNAPVNGAQPDDEITATATQISVPGSPNTNLPTPGNTSEYSNTVVAVVAGVGKVTGGGWYYQNAGATPAPSGVNQDRANFGFNAKYQHSGDTVPQGHTNFVFRPQSGSDIHFESTAYDPLSLVVTTEPITGYQHARWSGEGKLSVNGGKPQPGYFFMVNCTDRGEPGTNDSFRIQIRNQANVIIYDTVVEVTLGGGNIQVHMNSNAMEAAGGSVEGASGVVGLTDAQLAPVVQEAIVNWSQVGLPDSVLASLSQTKVQISHLSGSLVGLTAGDVIAIDPTAAGHGWSLDGSAPQAGRLDLLTVVTHELGHILGVGDLPTPGIMFGTLAAGVRVNIDGSQVTAPAAAAVTSTPPAATLSVTTSAVAAPTQSAPANPASMFLATTPVYAPAPAAASALVTGVAATTTGVPAPMPLAAVRTETPARSISDSSVASPSIGANAPAVPLPATEPTRRTEAEDLPVAPASLPPLVPAEGPSEVWQDAHDAFFTDEGSVHDLVLPGCDGLLIGEENGDVVSDAALALAGLAVAFSDLPADVALAESERRRRAGLQPPA